MNVAESGPILMNRAGVCLAHFEAISASPLSQPLVLIHGWTGDHRIFTPQIEHFANSRHVVAVNLRGHGHSDAPKQEYTIEGFADDVAWQCGELKLEKPLVIGHSMGGSVALELCGRHPELASGLVMIDSVVMPRWALRDSPEIGQFLDEISGSNYREVLRKNAWSMALDYDDPSRRESIHNIYIRASCEKTPQHVAYSVMRDFFLNYDASPAASRCKIPMAYIAADVPLVSAACDLDWLKARCSQLVLAKTLLAGHFNTIEVADQVNAMLDRFLAVGLRPRPTTGS
ncbi:alpha/beta fold hydrolase [Rhizobium mayense]|uniref:Alpha/beta hydrolase n=1 Tax=Rhizobium mayense TaxID=1312184 RepID=A0ABT7K4L6_9HYPH|nr:alpha/beta hydrolase [Rhizobium mayense]MDL2403561.1 alpha/beta hydrolase [Rhizobium mayense]